ncbi:MAG TPA: hypothetical protein PKC40_10150, partial [Saprospiraceae bacterium]|nr:hypothetical protein [Saprospiraceae bacterium]
FVSHSVHKNGQCCAKKGGQGDNTNVFHKKVGFKRYSSKGLKSGLSGRESISKNLFSAAAVSVLKQFFQFRLSKVNNPEKRSHHRRKF